MDALIFKNIVEFSLFNHRANIRAAITGYVSADDEECIFNVDMETIRPDLVSDYLNSFTSPLTRQQADELYDVLTHRKIFIEYREWQNITMLTYHYYQQVAEAINQPMEWFLVSPWKSKLQDLLDRSDVTAYMPLKYVPFTAERLSTTASNIHRYSKRFTPNEILNAYINSGQLITGRIHTDIDTLPLLVKAVDLGLWDAIVDREYTRELILTYPDKIINGLRFMPRDVEIFGFGERDLLSPFHSYILANATTNIPDTYTEKMSIIMNAPDDIILRAYRLSIMAATR